MKIRVPVKGLDVQMRVVTLDELERSYLFEVLKATGWRVKGDGGAAYDFKWNAIWLILFTVYQPSPGY